MQGKQLFWNEYGVGGGTNQDGKVKATTAEETAATPFFGVFGQYSVAIDPWELNNPGVVNGPRSYLHYFFEETIKYLNSGGVRPVTPETMCRVAPPSRGTIKPYLRIPCPHVFRLLPLPLHGASCCWRLVNGQSEQQAEASRVWPLLVERGCMQPSIGQNKGSRT